MENWRNYLNEQEEAIVNDDYAIIGSDHGTHKFAKTEISNSIPKIVWSESENTGMLEDAKLVGNHYFGEGRYKLKNWDTYEPSREEALAQDFLLGNYDSFKTQLDLSEDKTLLDAFMEAVGRANKTWLRPEVGDIQSNELISIAAAAAKFLQMPATDENLSAFDTAKNKMGVVKQADEEINSKRREHLLKHAKTSGGIFVIGAGHIDKFEEVPQ